MEVGLSFLWVYLCQSEPQTDPVKLASIGANLAADRRRFQIRWRWPLEPAPG
jgi:hypothetical protein